MLLKHKVFNWTAGLSQIITLGEREGVHAKAKCRRKLNPCALLTFLPRYSLHSRRLLAAPAVRLSGSQNLAILLKRKLCWPQQTLAEWRLIQSNSQYSLRMRPAAGRWRHLGICTTFLSISLIFLFFAFAKRWEYFLCAQNASSMNLVVS